jgi:membrane associated rhomboid family serine protease
VTGWWLLNWYYYSAFRFCAQGCSGVFVGMCVLDLQARDVLKKSSKKSQLSFGIGMVWSLIIYYVLGVNYFYDHLSGLIVGALCMY